MSFRKKIKKKTSQLGLNIERSVDNVAHRFQNVYHSIGRSRARLLGTMTRSSSMVSPSFSARRSSAPAVTAVCSSSPVALTSSDSGAQGFVIPGKLDQFLDGTLGDGVFGDGITEKNRAVLVYSGLPVQHVGESTKESRPRIPSYMRQNQIDTPSTQTLPINIIPRSRFDEADGPLRSGIRLNEASSANSIITSALSGTTLADPRKQNMASVSDTKPSRELLECSSSFNAHLHTSEFPEGFNDMATNQRQEKIDTQGGDNLNKRKITKDELIAGTAGYGNTTPKNANRLPQNMDIGRKENVDVMHVSVDQSAEHAQSKRRSTLIPLRNGARSVPYFQSAMAIIEESFSDGHSEKTGSTQTSGESPISNLFPAQNQLVDHVRITSSDNAGPLNLDVRIPEIVSGHDFCNLTVFNLPHNTSFQRTFNDAFSEVQSNRIDSRDAIDVNQSTNMASPPLTDRLDMDAMGVSGVALSQPSDQHTVADVIATCAPSEGLGKRNHTFRDNEHYLGCNEPKALKTQIESYAANNLDDYTGGIGQTVERQIEEGSHNDLDLEGETEDMENLAAYLMSEDVVSFQDLEEVDGVRSCHEFKHTGLCSHSKLVSDFQRFNLFSGSSIPSVMGEEAIPPCWETLFLQSRLQGSWFSYSKFSKYCFHQQTTTEVSAEELNMINFSTTASELPLPVIRVGELTSSVPEAQFLISRLRTSWFSRPVETFNPTVVVTDPILLFIEVAMTLPQPTNVGGLGQLFSRVRFLQSRLKNSWSSHGNPQNSASKEDILNEDYTDMDISDSLSTRDRNLEQLLSLSHLRTSVSQWSTSEDFTDEEGSASRKYDVSATSLPRPRADVRLPPHWSLGEDSARQKTQSIQLHTSLASKQASSGSLEEDLWAPWIHPTLKGRRYPRRARGGKWGKFAIREESSSSQERMISIKECNNLTLEPSYSTSHHYLEDEVYESIPSDSETSYSDLFFAFQEQIQGNDFEGYEAEGSESDDDTIHSAVPIKKKQTFRQNPKPIKQVRFSLEKSCDIPRRSVLARPRVSCEMMAEPPKTCAPDKDGVHLADDFQFVGISCADVITKCGKLVESTLRRQILCSPQWEEQISIEMRVAVGARRVEFMGDWYTGNISVYCLESLSGELGNDDDSGKLHGATDDISDGSCSE